ncbi:phage tail tape measure protein [Sinorhizobium meliloti]|nr:phage tail tape measure protein [Sinorhizobium meliloti]
MATTPEIKTRFSLDGLRQAATGLRGFARTLSDSLGEARRRGGRVFDPMGRGLDAVERKTKVVAKELTRLGAAGTFRGIRVGALGAGVAVGGLATKLSAVSAAALKAAQDSAASLKSISIDAQRIGGSASDVAVLGYAADLTGTDRDELVTQIATISNEFLTLRENIKKAQGQYRDFYAMAAKDAAVAARLGRRDDLNELISGFSAAELEARKASITDIEDRLARIDGALNSIEASKNVLYDGLNLTTAYDNVDTIGPSGPTYGNKGTDAAEGRLKLEKERRELMQARDDFWSSQSPQAQALRELQQYGIDIDRASKGGVEGLLEISDAFQHIQNPSQKARVAMRLFGEDAGVKLIPLLNGGRKAIDEYRKTLEESGAIATKQDVANAEAYSRAILNLKTATSGVQLTIGRALTPDLTKVSQELTTWLLKSREEIAKVAVEAFRDTRVFAEDAFSLVGGDTSSIQTKWLDSAVKKTVILRDVWADVRRQVGLLWDGKNSDYGWLNKLRDGFVEVKKFAIDAWAVVSGGNATNFDWLNKARDQVVAFAKRFADAFEMLKDVVKSLGEFFRPILDYFGTDIATLGLFLGLSRFVGLFSALTTGAGLLFKALGSVFSLAGGAVAAGKAIAGVGGGVGAASATAAGLTSSLLTVGSTISTIISSAALLGTSLAAGFALGQKAAEWFMKDTMKAYEQVWKAQSELVRAQEQPYINGLLSRRDDRGRVFNRKFWGDQNIDIGWQGMTTNERIAAGREQFKQNLGINTDPSLYSGRVYGGDVIGDSIRRQNAQPTQTIAVKLDVAGRQTTLYGDEVEATRFKRDLDLATRGY